jgi:hypothetical protein
MRIASRPDSGSLDLQQLLMSLYEEQVAGFYEPDSGMLFVLAESDPNSPELRFVVAHELVHALQHQYLPLDSIMKQRWNNDRLAAAQAVLEGQATLASILMMMPGQDLLADDTIWELFREQVSAARGRWRSSRRHRGSFRKGSCSPCVRRVLHALVGPRASERVPAVRCRHAGLDRAGAAPGAVRCGRRAARASAG